EVLPRWIPVVGGKSLPPRLVAVSSAALASAVGLLVSYYVIKEALGLDIGTSRPLPDGCSAPDLSVLVFYVPLIAWAPLLFLLTHHYYRRRISNTNPSEA
ncbi:MAG TPA: hypothetical protein VG845_12345, partial [Dehalococcoidia bacterium]|nr:hypothetical protein [Dehalococcoidia bacterium]